MLGFDLMLPPLLRSYVHSELSTSLLRPLLALSTLTGGLFFFFYAMFVIQQNGIEVWNLSTWESTFSNTVSKKLNVFSQSKVILWIYVKLNVYHAAVTQNKKKKKRKGNLGIPQI